MKDLVRTCAYCGKTFLCERASIYKVKTRRHVKRMCSYTCWTKYKEEINSEQGKNQEQVKGIPRPFAADFTGGQHSDGV